MYKVFKSSDNIKTYRNLIQSTNYNPYCLFSKNTIRDNKNKIIQMYQKGMKQINIARELKFSYSSVKQIIKEYKEKLNQK